jgi:penicillin-binding protein 1C
MSTLDGRLQERIHEIVSGHAPLLQANGVHNAAVVVASVETGDVLAYIGNMPDIAPGANGRDVDIIMSPRSTGSILKPFLYAAMLSDGLILPHTLIPDIPTQIGGFIPENFNRTFDGAVPASEALARSLNIPAVKMLQVYGYRQFYLLLRKAGLTTLKKPADYYGLALILGGAEASLWDLACVYTSMARSLRESESRNRNRDHPFFSLHFIKPQQSGKGQPPAVGSPFDPAAVWFTLDAMVEVARPGEDILWRQFSSSRRIAWKTGTSFGNRDAWAIGVTPEYIAGVWIGNASGEGRAGLTGIRAAAPVLLEVFRALPEGGWFEKPVSSMMQVEVCRKSGCRASGLCNEKEMAWIPRAGARSAACPYHQLAHLDSSGRWQVTANCADPATIRHLPWFVLPPVQEYYYRNRDPLYRVLPPYLPGCDPGSARRNMEIIYPNRNSVVYIPTDLNGRPGSTVFRLTHRFDDVTVYWHLDEVFLAATRNVHQVAVSPGRGNHTLTVTDQHGETLSLNFEVINEKSRETPMENRKR